MRHVKRLAPLLVSGLLIATATACAPQEEAEVAGPATVEVTRGDITVEVTASGNLAFSREEELSFDMAGTVEDIYVEEGDSVTKGEVVAILDTSEWEKQLRSLRLSVLSAQIALEQAQQALDEAEAETTVSIIGDVVVRECCNDKEIELREMQVEEAQLRLEDAEASLAEHMEQSPEVTAPFDGFVTQIGVEGGDEVFSGSVAVVVADPDQFEALILVSENDISKVAEGTRAQVSVDALPGVVLPAKVTHIAPTASITSGVVNYEVTIKVEPVETPGDQIRQQAEGPMPAGLDNIDLRQGMSVTVTLYPAQKSDVLVIPNAAIGVAGGRHVVTVVNDDGTQEQRQITTGISDWQYTEVVAGLEEGEVVLMPAGAAVTDREPAQRFIMGGRPHP